MDFLWKGSDEGTKDYIINWHIVQRSKEKSLYMNQRTNRTNLPTAFMSYDETFKASLQF